MTPIRLDSRRLFLHSTLAAIALLCGCNPEPGPSASGADAGAGPIRIGEFASLTGTEATFGQSSHQGTQLAIDEINKAGGVLGRQIELVTEDNQTKPGESATIAKKLINRDRVVALLGEVASGRSIEAAYVCQAAGIPMVSPSSTNPKVTEIGDFIFRVCFIDRFQGELLAKFAQRTLRAKKVAVLSDVSAPYSVGLAEFFTKPFLAAGGTITAEQKYQTKDKDFRAALTAIKATEPDAIFVPGYYTEAGLIVAQARQLGLTVPIFGGDGWESPQLIEIAGAALENTFYSTHYSPQVSSPESNAFTKAFQARFNGSIPDAMAALGYDSAMVLVDAIRRAGSTDPIRLKEALATTKDFPGVTGKTTLDAQRNASKGAVIMTVKEGRFRLVDTFTP